MANGTSYLKYKEFNIIGKFSNWNKIYDFNDNKNELPYSHEIYHKLFQFYNTTMKKFQ